MASEQIGTSVTSILEQSELFVYTTTRATNAMLTGDVASTAFLTTRGFPDTLVLRQGGRDSAYDFSDAFPKPYIPRRLTFEIDERIDAQSGIMKPLDEESTRAILRQLMQTGVQAVAVSLIKCVANPAHEQTVGRLIKEELPGIPYTPSRELDPIVGEHPRSSWAAIDASLKSTMQEHLRNVRDDLHAAGFTGELLGASSFGGTTHMEGLIKPTHLHVEIRTLARPSGRTPVRCRRDQP